MKRILLAAMLLGGCVAARPEPARPMVQTAPPLAPPLAPPGDFMLEGSATQGGLMRGLAPPATIALRLDDAPVALAGDGRFLIAFDRDAGPTVRLTATLSDGRSVVRKLMVAPRAWRIERLDRVAKVPLPDPEFAARRPAELATIKAARATVNAGEGWRQAFVWPATGRISGLFGAQRIYRGEPGSYHSGIDIARPAGAVVVSPADGVVTLAADRPFTLEGNLLIVDHGMGLSSAFLHLSRIDVRVGAHVRQGQAIGAVGATGRASGPHLHWGLTWRGARLDPLLVTPPMPRG